MVGLFSWLKRLANREKGKVKFDDLFSPVDPKKVIELLDVEFFARQSGEQELPAADSDSFDSNELKIAHFFEEDAQDTAQRANDKLQNYRRSINLLDIHHNQQSIESAHSRYTEESRAFLLECRDQLKPYITKRSELTAELKDFKQHNKIRKSADYPESRFLFFAILLVLLVFESVMNALFFAAGSDFGLIGGWINAMQYATVNIAVAFLISLAIVRQINHVYRWRKVIGLLGIVSLVIFIPAFNLFVGHFREIFAVTPTEAQREAVNSFLSNPLGLNTVESWLLFAMGVIFACIAAFEAYRIDDPYPGYGRLSRRLEQAREHYAEEKEILKNQLSDLRASMTDHLDEARDSVVQREEELNDLASMGEMIRARFNSHHALLQRTCNVVISHYRQINQGVRQTSPPVYFNNSYEFSNSLTLSLPDTITTDEVNERKQGITSVLNLIEKKRSDIQASYAQDLQSIDDTIQKLEYGAR